MTKLNKYLRGISFGVIIEYAYRVERNAFVWTLIILIGVAILVDIFTKDK